VRYIDSYLSLDKLDQTASRRCRSPRMVATGLETPRSAEHDPKAPVTFPGWPCQYGYSQPFNREGPL